MTEQNFQAYKKAHHHPSTDCLRATVTAARGWNPKALDNFSREEVLRFYSSTLR